MKVIGRLWARVGVRMLAEVAGVVAIAVGASMWHVALGPLVIGAYLVIWANLTTGGE